MLTRKLIVEQPNYDLDFEHIQEARDSEKRYYIKGRYLMMNKKNKNNRTYEESEFIPAVETFIENYIKTDRAGGELNHSTTPDIDLGKLADKILSLERDKDDPNYWIGRSMVLSTPSGKVLESLIKDGLKFGKSSKCLGQITEAKGDKFVKSPLILTVDNVYDPSVSDAFVEGILENKEYIVGDDNRVYEAYKKMEQSLSKYPSKHRDAIRQHIMESLQTFLKSI